ncbi:hypothetical protein MHTCC0001_30080 [Flavobacteriaceae bacterium MHTCC 0001]
MSSTFKAKVNNSFDFDIALNDILNLDIATISKTEYHLLNDHISYTAKIITSNFNSKTYRISVNNTVYNVDISNELDKLITSMGFSMGSKPEIKSIKAPMPGLILDINVSAGQEVQENDALLILEAMKMENSITSPIDGTIKAVHATKGEAVEKGQLIIEFE